MKVRILVTPKPGVLDPEGRAVGRALQELGFDSVGDVRTGKLIVLDIADDDETRVRALVTEACEKLLANPVIEQYSIELPSGDLG